MPLNHFKTCFSYATGPQRSGGHRGQVASDDDDIIYDFSAMLQRLRQVPVSGIIFTDTIGHFQCHLHPDQVKI